MAARKYYAQVDALGFPIPGTLMSVASNRPIPVDCIEIPAEDTITSPENVHPYNIRYFVRHDSKGVIIPNSLISTIKRPQGLVYEFQPMGTGSNTGTETLFTTETGDQMVTETGDVLVF